MADEKGTRELMTLFPHARLDVSAVFGGATRPASGRHKPLDIYQKIDLTYNPGTEKMHAYGELLREMLRDQIRWIYNRNHPRKLTEQNGRDSLAMAADATALADELNEATNALRWGCPDAPQTLAAC